MKGRGRIVGGIALLGWFLIATGSMGASRTWDNGGDRTNWFDAANWDLNVLPADGDAVVIPAGFTSIMLTNSTPQLDSLTITSSTLTFTNWNTALRATNVFVQTGAVLPHALCNTNALLSNTNRVYVECSNLTVDAGAFIDANWVGYPGGASGQRGQGPGGGYAGSDYSCCGGSYGGSGGKGQHGGALVTIPPYGSPYSPSDAGSGGGGSVRGGASGNGGGLIWISAAGKVTVNGTIRADGQNPVGSYSGPGAGGGIYILCRSFAGSGILEAKGAGNSGAEAGASGGGRIGVFYNAAAQAAEPAQPTATFSAMRGTIGSQGRTDHESGTVYIPDSRFLPGPLKAMFPDRIFVYGVSAWTPAAVTVTNTTVTFMEPGFQLTVTNDLLVGTSGILSFDISNQTANVGGNIVLTNTATFRL